MKHEVISLREGFPEATLTTYVLDNPPELNMPPRPGVIVCPGGAYHSLSDREAEPIAAQFLAAGCNAFILRYSLRERAVDWNPLIEAALAIRHVRLNAQAYDNDPERVFICGFSAGGHLACSAGTLWNLPEVRDAVDVTSGQYPEGINRPTGMILGYPVISAGDFGHTGSISHIAGHKELTEQDIADFSLELRVDDTTPPAFIWHTCTDSAVPAENSLLYAAALSRHKIPYELHVFPRGKHGLALCNDFTKAGKESYLEPSAEIWMSLAVQWVKRFPGSES